MDFVDDHLSGVAAALSERYILDRELGRGGMATVHLAEDLKHGPKPADERSWQGIPGCCAARRPELGLRL